MNVHYRRRVNPYLFVTEQIVFRFASIVLIKRCKNIIAQLALTHQETLMNKDQVKGHIEEAKGKVKEVTGKILDDKEMEVEGNIQKNIGKVKAGVGNIKEDIKKGS
jgi:uncharacterized protein YjbJ (UPF0337 family)